MARHTHELILIAVSQGRASRLRGARLTTNPAMRALRAQAQELQTELDVLNYALTLEHLEATFYRQGLETFGAGDFAAGVFDNLALVRDHEAAHVETLTQIIDLGGVPVEAAEYDFGYGDDPGEFLGIAATLENVGVAAYDGAASSLTDSGLLTAALTIHGVEAQHASYLNHLLGEVPFPRRSRRRCHRVTC